MPKKKAVEPALDELNYIEKDLRTLAVPIAELSPDPHQARQHDQRSVDEIKRSLHEHGQKKAIVVQREGMIVKAGNGTLAAAKDLGWTHLAAVVSDDPAEELRRFAIRDNRTAELSAWDADMLISEFDDLGLEYEEFGWYEDEFVDLVEQIDTGDLPPDEEDIFRNITFKGAPDGTVPFRFAMHRAYISEDIYKLFSSKVDALKNEMETSSLEDVLRRMFDA